MEVLSRRSPAYKEFHREESAEVLGVSFLYYGYLTTLYDTKKGVQLIPNL